MRGGESLASLPPPGADLSQPPFTTRAQVNAVPSILMAVPRPAGEDGEGGMPPGAPPGGSGRGVAMSFQPYTGPMRYAKIHEWLRIMAIITGSWRGDLPPELRGMGGGAGSAGGAPPPPPGRITDDASLDEQCVRHGGGLCVILLLPGAAAAPGAAPPAALAAAAGRADQPVRFLWADGDAAATLGTLFGVGRGQPAVAALSPKKLRFSASSLKGEQPTSAAIAEFVDAVLAGKAGSQPLAALPSLSAGGAGDGGAAADVEPIEEEFDLSDIMGEAVGEGGALGGTKAERIAALEAEEAAKAAADAAAAASKKKGKKKKGGKKKAAAAPAKEEL